MEQKKSKSEIVDLDCKTPFEANALDTLSADAIILGTTENLGYMSGALKDFFDRTYNETIEKRGASMCDLYQGRYGWNRNPAQLKV